LKLSVLCDLGVKVKFGIPAEYAERAAKTYFADSAGKSLAADANVKSSCRLPRTAEEACRCLGRAGNRCGTFKSMTIRTLFLFMLTALLAATAAQGQTGTMPAAPALQAPTSLPVAQHESQEKHKTPPSALAVKEDAVPREHAVTNPLVLKGGMDDFAEKPVEAVQVFEGTQAFQRFCVAEKIGVWPIGEYASAKEPKDEAAFREILRKQAAKFGADYVVVYSNLVEIKRLFPSALSQLNYCARAYRRVTARVGFEIDPVAAKDDVVKIRGFAAGSLGQVCGLRIGDIIKKVDGQQPGNNININHEYWVRALHWKVGDKIKVEVERDEKTVELEVELVAG